MKLDPETERTITERASTDSLYAIAAAILELAAATESVACQLKYLGTGNAATQMGAIEYLASEVKGGLQSIGEAITENDLNKSNFS
jgi:hypothetical protein